jgi:hypothetical protein
MHALPVVDRGYRGSGDGVRVEEGLSRTDDRVRCRACAERIEASEPLTIQGDQAWHVTCWIDAVTMVA